MIQSILGALALALFAMAFVNIIGPTAASQPADSMRLVLISASAVLGLCAWLTGDHPGRV
ncbi:hypothetical protein Pla123a_02840 [Posidoniimonas polymericola]|uniref:Uncharacterized protein n=1 Tax=Posidoniimonas polymericola TaxID=2528002 RepID=A0A5C5ZEJ1_9BACT|nr:hypothetical protein [Posidoniimonas polymericola]TWT85477.1 hypothetical protein Pla123a_02840 [Posidoniimonas polymericola]